MGPFRRLATILFCLNATAIASDASASILVPKFTFEHSANDVLDAVDRSENTSTQTCGSRNSGPSAPLPHFDENRHLCQNAYAGLLGSNSSSNMTGGSSPSWVGGGDLVVASDNDALTDDSFKIWLSQSKWLAIPMTPGATLLQPPQAA
jgi:hypothetical protein